MLLLLLAVSAAVPTSSPPSTERPSRALAAAAASSPGPGALGGACAIGEDASSSVEPEAGGVGGSCAAAAAAAALLLSLSPSQLLLCSLFNPTLQYSPEQAAEEPRTMTMASDEIRPGPVSRSFSAVRVRSIERQKQIENPPQWNRLYAAFLAFSALMSAIRFSRRRIQGPVARFRLATRPRAAHVSIKSFVGLNCRATPNSEAA
mmetsp:Transcript_11438/g.32917  ORF Transcript_11438/g.32917 Transcript_11438/m.32917 type:complete len:205 (-) Transcript_11438:866-1480(-)